MLVIYETKRIPKGHYASVSYPWIGVPTKSSIPIMSTFRVPQPVGSGIEGDPISTEVLQLACTVALRHEAKFLWVDRLCVSQLDTRDKRWQIHQMCDVYKHCRICIVLPGGLQRLTDISEETSWMMRMWTLQEAIVPPLAEVLYEDWFSARGFENSRVKKLADDSAITCHAHAYSCSLGDTIWHCSMGPMRGRLFDHENSCFLREAVTWYNNSTSSDRDYKRYLAIWQSAITRSSYRPEDLLLSTMGILDVTLQEGEERDRESVLGAFVREFTKSGIADSRVVALRNAIGLRSAISNQWKELIDDFNGSLPLVINGIAPDANHVLDLTLAGPPVSIDAYGRQIFLGSALLINKLEQDHSLHPCRIVVSSPDSFTCLVPFGGKEVEHDGRWQLMPFDPEQMEWVFPSDGGMIPLGRQAVQGGYEPYNFQRITKRDLYYGLVSLISSDGKEERYAGKLGEHLGRCQSCQRYMCNYGLNGEEHEACNWRILYVSLYDAKCNCY